MLFDTYAREINCFAESICPAFSPALVNAADVGRMGIPFLLSLRASGSFLPLAPGRPFFQVFGR